MNTSHIDRQIEYFSQSTHLPRGRYAASEEIYRELLGRLPESDYPRQDISAPVPARGGANARSWSAAAGVALVVGIGIAIAGVYTYRSGFFSGSDPVREQAPATETITSQTLVFDNTPLSQIAAALTEAYGTHIIFSDQALADCRITATFSTDESLEDILDAITEAGGMAYRKVNGGYVICETAWGSCPSAAGRTCRRRIVTRS